MSKYICESDEHKRMREAPGDVWLVHSELGQMLTLAQGPGDALDMAYRMWPAADEVGGLPLRDALKHTSWAATVRKALACPAWVAPGEVEA